MKRKALYRLYWEEGLTIRQIAERMGLDQATVWYWMNKYGIPRRPCGYVKRFDLGKEQLQDLYWNKGLSTTQIAGRAGMSPETVRYWMKKYKVPRRTRKQLRRKIPLRMDENLAYVFGVLDGDAWFGELDHKHYISLLVKDLDFAKVFAFHLSKVLERPIVPRQTKRGHKVESYVPKCLAPFFKRYPTKTENWRVPDFVMHGYESIIIAFLQGLADSEGYSGNFCVRFSSTNSEGLEQVRVLLRKVGFVYGKVSVSGGKLTISGRRNLKLFYKKVGFSIKRRQKKLLRMLQKYKTINLD